MCSVERCVVRWGDRDMFCLKGDSPSVLWRVSVDSHGGGLCIVELCLMTENTARRRTAQGRGMCCAPRG